MHRIPHPQLPWLQDRTILYVVHGSRAYGTSRPDSDFDYKGVAIPPACYREGFMHHFEQAELREPEDSVIYSLPKLMNLAADCNPNIIEILWSEESSLLICTPLGRLLVEHKELFLSQKALHTFRGYAMAQLKRIRTHRKWLLEPPDHQPRREEFGLPLHPEVPQEQRDAAEAAIRKQVDHWEIDFGDLSEASKIYVLGQIQSHLAEMGIGHEQRYRAAGRLLGFGENFLDLMERERAYRTAQNHWEQYQVWKSQRNVTRADLEAHHGYDTKHGMHLVRLMRMCREILEQRQVLVRRPDAQELLAIRNGAWSYDQLVAWAEEQDRELVEVARRSTLPRSPDRKALNELCIELTRKSADAWDDWRP